MKIEEVAEQLNDLIKDRESFLNGEDDEIYRRDIEALRKAVEAVEKQAPQRPLDGYDMGGNYYNICRNCSATVADGEWRANYCPDCGQAVKWKGFSTDLIP